MRHMAVVEQDPTSVGASVPDLPVWAAVGESEEEALALLRDAIEMHLKALCEQGLPVPVPTLSSVPPDVAA